MGFRYKVTLLLRQQLLSGEEVDRPVDFVCVHSVGCKLSFKHLEFTETLATSLASSIYSTRSHSNFVRSLTVWKAYVTTYRPTWHLEITLFWKLDWHWIGDIFCCYCKFQNAAPILYSIACSPWSTETPFEPRPPHPSSYPNPPPPLNKYRG